MSLMCMFVLLGMGPLRFITSIRLYLYYYTISYYLFIYYIYYAPARREGGSELCFCPSVRLFLRPSRTYRITRPPEGLGCQNSE